MRKIWIALLLLAALPAKADRAADLDRLATRYHALGQLDGAVLVADHGKVVYQRAFGLANREWRIPHSTDTAFRIASLTKPVTTVAALTRSAELVTVAPLDDGDLFAWTATDERGVLMRARRTELGQLRG